jgi:hypothetical protein
VLRIVAGEPVNGRPVLRLEGQVIGPWVDELRRACETLAGGAVTLDLADVSFVGRRGVELLRALGAGGVAVTRCSPFVAEQLKAQP